MTRFKVCVSQYMLRLIEHSITRSIDYGIPNTVLPFVYIKHTYI